PILTIDILLPSRICIIDDRVNLLVREVVLDAKEGKLNQRLGSILDVFLRLVKEVPELLRPTSLDEDIVDIRNLAQVKVSLNSLPHCRDGLKSLEVETALSCRVNTDLCWLAVLTESRVDSERGSEELVSVPSASVGFQGIRKRPVTFIDNRDIRKKII